MIKSKFRDDDGGLIKIAAGSDGDESGISRLSRGSLWKFENLTTFYLNSRKFR
jgi:hypothetical protein